MLNVIFMMMIKMIANQTVLKPFLKENPSQVFLGNNSS